MTNHQSSNHQSKCAARGIGGGGATKSFRLGEEGRRKVMAMSGKMRAAGSTECFRYEEIR
jgi:hypothetical protein